MIHVLLILMLHLNRCSTPAPTTASGYTQLWAGLDTAQWGAADGAESIPMPDGRIVWLYGDTFSNGRFAHSTAIVQTKGCLHVSHAGAQLLPNDDVHHIYWIEYGTPTSGGLLIRARSVVLTGTCGWCFADGGFTHTAYVTLDRWGNLTFRRWVALTHDAAPDPGPLYDVGGPAHHFGYNRLAHPEARLASGAMLYTTCQNWDDGKYHPYASYRPIFTEGIPA